MSKLDDIEVEIEFHEGEHTSHESGQLTLESKERIKDIIDGLLYESDEPGSPKSLRSETDILEGLAEL